VIRALVFAERGGELVRRIVKLAELKMLARHGLGVRVASQCRERSPVDGVREPEGEAAGQGHRPQRADRDHFLSGLAAASANGSIE
jgi:hypothetical protein